MNNVDTVDEPHFLPYYGKKIGLLWKTIVSIFEQTIPLTLGDPELHKV